MSAGNAGSGDARPDDARDDEAFPSERAPTEPDSKEPQLPSEPSGAPGATEDGAPASSASARPAVAAIAVVLGTWALIEAQSMSRLGSVFPTSAGLVLLIGGIASAAFGWRARRTPAGAAKRDGEPSTDAPSRGAAPLRDDATVLDEAASAAALRRVSRPRWFAVVVTLLAWVLLLDALGFLFASAAGMVAIAAATWRGPLSAASLLRHAVVFAVLLGGFYAIMRFVLRIAVP